MPQRPNMVNTTRGLVLSSMPSSAHVRRLEQRMHVAVCMQPPPPIIQWENTKLQVTPLNVFTQYIEVHIILSRRSNGIVRLQPSHWDNELVDPQLCKQPVSMLIYLQAG